MTEIESQGNHFIIDGKHYAVKPDKLNKIGVNHLKIESYDVLLKICRENNLLDNFKNEMIEKLQKKISQKNERLLKAMIEYIKSLH